MSAWYRKIADDVEGPYSLDELRFLKNRKLLSPHDLVGEQENGDWHPAAMISGLFPPPGDSVSVDQSSATDDDEIADAGREAHAPTAAIGVVEQAFPVEAPPSSASFQLPLRLQAIMIGTGIGAGLALIIVLLLMLWLKDGRDDGDAVAGAALGDQGSQVADGSSEADTDDRRVEDASAADDQDEIVYEGEISEHDPRVDNPSRADSSTEATVDPSHESSPARFTVRPLRTPPPDNGQAGGRYGTFQERLEREGGKSGEVQITLIWNDLNDLDLHVVCPSGEEISYRHRKSRCGGELDVDMNASATHTSREPVENVFWSDGEAPAGQYRVYVNHYRWKGGPNPSNFEVAIKYDGRIKKFSGSISRGQPKRLIHRFRRR